MFKLGELFGLAMLFTTTALKFAAYATLNPVTQIIAMWIWLPTFWWFDVFGGFIPFWMPVRFLTYWAFGA